MPELERFTSLAAALIAAFETAPYLPRDRGAVELALRYAEMIDDAADRMEGADEEDESRAYGRYVTVVTKLGPRLEAMLDRLGMAPGARPALRGGDPHGVDPGAAALGELESGRPGSPAPGVDQTAFVDPAVTGADAED